MKTKERVFFQIPGWFQNGKTVLVRFRLYFLCLLIPHWVSALEYNLADSLRGHYNADRSCYDLKHYFLSIKIRPETKFIEGFSEMDVLMESESRRLQIDLAGEFDIDSIVSPFGMLKWSREDRAVLVNLKKERKKGERFWVRVYYHGHPRIAENPPWEGGFVWQKDQENQPWIGLACEGEGSSVWFPSKDHPADEADSATMEFEIPENFKVVSNGRFLGRTFLNDSVCSYRFKVSYPINHYNITFNAGNFVSWEEERIIENKPLKMSFFAHEYELENAKKQFSQAGEILKILSGLFGPFPFPRDGYKVVRTPYLGMEHQSCIAHGDKLQNNAFGFDFILMHETGHEWWGNRTSASDHADMWIHESFCTYAEALFVESKWDRKRAEEYLLTQKKKIRNKSPVQGPGGVYFNDWKDSDMYYKGSWMLHSLRYVIDNDSLWFAWLKSFGPKFGFAPVSGEQVVEYACSFFSRDLKPFFCLYLHKTDWPIVEYKWETGSGTRELYFRLHPENADFQYAVPVKIDGKTERIFPGREWKKCNQNYLSGSEPEADPGLFLFRLKAAGN